MEELKKTEIIKKISKTAAAYFRLYETIGTLRAPGGCPWDRDQTPLSMRKNLVEEAFEAVDAITQEDSLHVKEELGDVILNASMIAYMYEQQNDFGIDEVLNELVEKLIRRHPHVFPKSEGKICMNTSVKNSEEVITQWDAIKSKVEGRSSNKTILDEVPSGFPPLLKAFKMQKKASKKNFDWQKLDSVYNKIQEELEEVQQAVQTVNKINSPENTEKSFTNFSTTNKNNAQIHLEEEIGDLLFTIVNYSRHLGVDPSLALNNSNQKFYNRFSFVEQKMKSENIQMNKEHLAEMKNFWNEAKQKENKQ